MILRPEDDSGLLALLRDVLADVHLSGDTRALLASLLCCRDVENFPLLSALGATVGMSIGPERGRRMLNELRAGGYLVRAFWPVPYRGHVPAFTSVCGNPRAVAAMVARESVAMRTPSKVVGQR